MFERCQARRHSLCCWWSNFYWSEPSTTAVYRIGPTAATLLFLLYAGINGSRAPHIFLAYTHAVIASAFIVTAGMFLAMSLYGFVTRRDLTSMGALFCSWPYWPHSRLGRQHVLAFNALTIAINYVGVLIFVGLTAYDTQRSRHWPSKPPATAQWPRAWQSQARSLSISISSTFSCSSLASWVIVAGKCSYRSAGQAVFPQLVPNRVLNPANAVLRQGGTLFAAKLMKILLSYNLTPYSPEVRNLMQWNTCFIFAQSVPPRLYMKGSTTEQSADLYSETRGGQLTLIDWIETGSLEDRYLGAIFGLAIGDAIGTTLEFSTANTSTPLTDMMGGGPFGLKKRTMDRRHFNGALPR